MFHYLILTVWHGLLIEYSQLLSASQYYDLQNVNHHAAPPPTQNHAQGGFQDFGGWYNDQWEQQQWEPLDEMETDFYTDDEMDSDEEMDLEEEMETDKVDTEEDQVKF
ncbi:unnamed protein product [Caenorhabditis brenneri]